MWCYFSITFMSLLTRIIVGLLFSKFYTRLDNSISLDYCCVTFKIFFLFYHFYDNLQTHKVSIRIITEIKITACSKYVKIFWRDQTSFLWKFHRVCQIFFTFSTLNWCRTILRKNSLKVSEEIALLILPYYANCQCPTGDVTI